MDLLIGINLSKYIPWEDFFREIKIWKMFLSQFRIWTCEDALSPFTLIPKKINNNANTREQLSVKYLSGAQVWQSAVYSAKVSVNRRSLWNTVQVNRVTSAVTWVFIFKEGGRGAFPRSVRGHTIHKWMVGSTATPWGPIPDWFGAGRNKHSQGI